MNSSTAWMCHGAWSSTKVSSLAKEFGGTDGYKYVNAVLNALAPSLRAAEVTADRNNAA